MMLAFLQAGAPGSGSDMAVVLWCAIFMAAVFFYIFYPATQVASAADKTRVAFLNERKEQVYENLRDLNFEYRAGKYPEEDFLAQRTVLENETAQLLSEIEFLQGA